MITAFMIVRDEERLLPRCLDDLAGVADELVVLDTGSRDRTPQVLAAAAAGGAFARVQWRAHPFTGFGAARQAALDLVRTEWALWMDADELLSPALRARLLELKAGGGLAACDGWEMPRENRVLGRIMTGRNLRGQHVLRLFRAARGRLSSSLVHEGIALAPGARLGRLAEPILHDAMDDWRAYLAKIDLYTDLEVMEGTRRFNPGSLLVAGPLAFAQHWLGRGGWRDGWPGFVWAFTAGWSSFLRNWKRGLKTVGLFRPRRLPA